MDDDGYPTEELLEYIKNYKINSFGNALIILELVKDVWWSKNMLVWEEDGGDTLHMATGGWSGNESLIYAMQENYILWHLLWHSSTRGGKYVFDLANWKK